MLDVVSDLLILIQLPYIARAHVKFSVRPGSTDVSCLWQISLFPISIPSWPTRISKFRRRFPVNTHSVSIWYHRNLRIGIWKTMFKISLFFRNNLQSALQVRYALASLHYVNDSQHSSSTILRATTDKAYIWIGLHLFNDDTRPSGYISHPFGINSIISRM